MIKRQRLQSHVDAWASRTATLSVVNALTKTCMDLEFFSRPPLQRAPLLIS